MKIEYEGRVYDYDPEELSVKQAAKIERHVWRGSLDAAKAGVQMQAALLEQKAPGADLGPLRQAVDALTELAERTGTGTLLDWERGLLQARSDCVQALAWLLFENGRQVPVADVDVKVVKLHGALIRAMTEAAEDRADESPISSAAALDPTADPPAEVPADRAANGRTRSRRASSPTG